MIPKRIIQTGPPNLSLILRSAIVNVTLLHPSFEYLFFDDDQIVSFLEENYPQYRSVFDSFPFRIQKYDFFRYLAVYHYGGFYLDLDVFLARELTPLVSQQCVFPFEELTTIRYLEQQFGMDWQVGNYAFGAKAGHPFLAAIIDNCVRAQTDPSWVRPMMDAMPLIKWMPKRCWNMYYVLNSTGPGLVSRTLAENPQHASDLNILFPDDVRDMRTWYHFGEFGVHHMVNSWQSPNSLIVHRLGALWEAHLYHRVFRRSKSTAKTRRPSIARSSVVAEFRALS